MTLGSCRALHVSPLPNPFPGISPNSAVWVPVACLLVSQENVPGNVLEGGVQDIGDMQTAWHLVHTPGFWVGLTSTPTGQDYR